MTAVNGGSPVRVQRKRTKGFNLQNASPNGLPVVYVGRPSKWGNRYEVGVIVPAASDLPIPNRETAKILYEDLVIRYDRVLEAEIILELRGMNLACWCPLDEPCHADVLLEIANG